MTQPAVNMDQVAALFDERQRYESWLSMLEAKRASTPAHIYDRVHADYAARLQRVIEELASHRTVLQEMERHFMDRLTSLDIDDAKNRDEAAEAELRSTVGELSGDRHEEIQNRTSAALTAVSEDRARVAEELARLRAVLAASGIAPSAPRSPTPAVSSAVAAAEAAASAATKKEEWQLSFERTATPAPARTSRVPGTPGVPPATVTPPGGAPAAAASRPNDAEVRGPTGGPFDDLEFLKTMIDPRTSGEGVAVGSGAGASGGNTRSAASGSATPADVSRISGASSMPSVGRAVEDQSLPKDGGVDQVKTLKCQECGTLNYPTEWYCERCGAELAAL
ncbi:MAG TPA: hypothetical protein VIC55_08805 [Gemmatimonadaceae bacterium]|jgi:hypothetical protein